MLAKYMGRHKRGLLAIYVIGLFLLFIFIRSLFVRSVQASVSYDILYFHAGNTMDQNAGASQVSTKISPGAMTLTIRPNSDVSVDWTPKSGGSNYVEIYEVTHDDDTSYVSVSKGQRVDQYGLDDHTTESGTISQVKMYIWCYQTGAENLDIGIVSGAVTDVVTLGPGGSWTEYTNVWTTDPNTGSAWTWTAIDALNAYIKSINIGGWSGTQYVTQIYYEVTYYDSSISWSASYWTDDWWVGVSSAWSVVFYFDALGGELATGTVTVTVGLTGPPGADKTPVSQTGVSCSGDTGSSQTTTHDVSGWADRDATTTWLNDDEAANPSRTLSVTIEITSGGPIAIEYDAPSSPGNSRLNTGTIVPENFLQLIFAAPFIPLIAKAVARLSERGKRSVSRDGEKRGRQ